MTFGRDGAGDIHQVGTDNDLSSLGGNPEVTRHVYGEVIFYVVAAETQLFIEGTVRHNPEKEVIIFLRTAVNNCMVIGASASYTLGVTGERDDDDTINRYSAGIAFYFVGNTGASTAASWNSATWSGIHIVDGGSITFRGGSLLTTRLFGPGEGDLDIVGTKFTKHPDQSGRREIRFEKNTGNANTDVFKDAIVDGMTVTHRDLPNTFSPILLNSNVNQLATTTGSTHTIRNLDTKNNIASYDLGTDSLGNSPVLTYEVINSTNGSNTRLMPKQGVGDTRQLGILIVKQEFKLTSTDDEGNVIEGVKRHVTDRNNGFRKNANGLDSRGTKRYTGISDASGVDEGVITTAITNIDTNGSFQYNDWDTENHSDRYKVDRRGQLDDGSDSFIFKFGSFLHKPSQAEFVLRGLGRIPLAWTHFPDTELIETDQDTIRAYTRLETAEKLYDRWKLYWYEHYAGESDLIADRAGDTIDFGSANVSLAANYIHTENYAMGDVTYHNGAIWQAVEATTGAFNLNSWEELFRDILGVFTQAGTTVHYFYYGTQFTGHIVTTGNVIAKFFHHIDGTIIDASFDSSLTFDGIDSWEVYLTDADRQAETNRAGSGRVEENFRFAFSAGTIYYLVLHFGGESLNKNVEPTAKGVFEVELSTQALLNASLRKLEIIQETVEDIDSLTEDDGSGNLRFSSKALEEASGGSSTEIANAVWNATTGSHGATGSFGAKVRTLPNASDVTADVWDRLLTNHTTSGSTGAAIQRILDATKGPFTHTFFDSDGSTEVFDEAVAYQVRFYDAEGIALATFAKQTSDTDTTRVTIQSEGKLIRL